MGGQLGCRPRENVEDDRFLLGHVFAHMPPAPHSDCWGASPVPLQLFDVAAVGAVALDQCLELLGEISARTIDPDYPFQLGADGLGQCRKAVTRLANSSAAGSGLMAR